MLAALHEGSTGERDRVRMSRSGRLTFLPPVVDHRLPKRRSRAGVPRRTAGAITGEFMAGTCGLQLRK